MSHFYNKDGVLYDTIPNKSRPGEVRDFTLADARKHYEATGEILFSSVSTELQVLARPELNLWFNEQAIKQSLADPHDGTEDRKAYIRKIALRAGDEGKRAADYGTEIHGFIAEFLGGKKRTRQDFIASKHIAEAVCEWLKKEGYHSIQPEEHVVNSELGVAGTIDLRCLKLDPLHPCPVHGLQKPYPAMGNCTCFKILGDFKTTTPPLTYRKEHGYQVAGYDAILGGWADERHILYINRETIGDVNRVLCTEPQRDDRIWALVHQLWSELNKWPPRRK